MASSSAPRVKSFIGSGVIPAYSFVKLSANDTVITCGLNERACGIAQNSAASVDGDIIEVALPGAGAKLKCGETIALGKFLTSSAGGLGSVTDAAGEFCAAVAYESGVLNDVIGVEVACFLSAATDV